eukprot:TRINITY_DN45660_c0_g1_i1.p1 TRINITY_DN45660_c0_g1~~TRINITY_DN45660_c0_g1_i1.p1  ORF type:complete len:368 (-),score=66.15 TRINITY_DN45660_c0_g1_i1:83-1186(-)
MQRTGATSSSVAAASRTPQMKKKNFNLLPSVATWLDPPSGKFRDSVAINLQAAETASAGAAAVVVPASQWRLTKMLQSTKSCFGFVESLRKRFGSSSFILVTHRVVREEEGRSDEQRRVDTESLVARLLARGPDRERLLHEAKVEAIIWNHGVLPLRSSSGESIECVHSLWELGVGATIDGARAFFEREDLRLPCVELRLQPLSKAATGLPDKHWVGTREKPGAQPPAPMPRGIAQRYAIVEHGTASWRQTLLGFTKIFTRKTDVAFKAECRSAGFNNTMMLPAQSGGVVLSLWELSPGKTLDDLMSFLDQHVPPHAALHRGRALHVADRALGLPPCVFEAEPQAFPTLLTSAAPAESAEKACGGRR